MPNLKSSEEKYKPPHKKQRGRSRQRTSRNKEFLKIRNNETQVNSYNSQRGDDRQVKRNPGWMGTPIPPNRMVLQGNPIKCAGKPSPPMPPSPATTLRRRISPILPTPWCEAPPENCLATTPKTPLHPCPARLGLAAPLPILTPVGPSPPAFPSEHGATRARTSSPFSPPRLTH